MNKIINTVIIMFVLASGTVSAQNIIKTSTYTNWHVDVLGDIIISTPNTLLKYNAQGEQLAIWASGTNSNITSFDAGNALRVVVFQKETYQIHILDRNLIEIIQPVNLSLSQFSDIIAACGSSMNGFWIVDAITQELYHIQSNLTINQTTNLQKYLNVSEIKKIIEYNRNIWILTERNKWHIFDMFGSHLTQYTEEGLQTAQISKSPIIYTTQNAVYEYNTQTRDTNLLYPPTKDVESAFIFNDKLYLFQKKQITIISDFKLRKTE